LKLVLLQAISMKDVMNELKLMLMNFLFY